MCGIERVLPNPNLARAQVYPPARNTIAQTRGTRLPTVAIVDFDRTGIDSNARAMQDRGMTNQDKAAATRAIHEGAESAAKAYGQGDWTAWLDRAVSEVAAEFGISEAAAWELV